MGAWSTAPGRRTTQVGGGPHTHGRGAPPPALVCVHIGHANQGPAREWESVPLLPPCAQRRREWGTRKPRSGAPPPLRPRPSQRGHANRGPRANPHTPSFSAGVTCKWEAAREWEGVPPSLFGPPSLFVLCAQRWSANRGPCANPEAAPPPPGPCAGVTCEWGLHGNRKGVCHLPPVCMQGGHRNPGLRTPRSTPSPWPACWGDTRMGSTRE